MAVLSETRSAPTASPAAWLAQSGGQGHGKGGWEGEEATSLRVCTSFHL